MMVSTIIISQWSVSSPSFSPWSHKAALNETFVSGSINSRYKPPEGGVHLRRDDFFDWYEEMNGQGESACRLLRCDVGASLA